MAQRLCIYYPGKHLVFISQKNPPQPLKAQLACGPTSERTVCRLATGLKTHTRSVYFLLKIIGPGLQVYGAFLLEKALIFILSTAAL